MSQTHCENGISGAPPFPWDRKHHREPQMVSCVWRRSTVPWAGQSTGTPFPEPPGFTPSVTAVAATARPNRLAASMLLSSAFAGGRSLALRSDRPIKSHTLGVNLAPRVFASTLPTATAGSCAFPWPLPHPGAQRSGCDCLALPGSRCQAARCPGPGKAAGFQGTCFTVVSWFSRKTCLSKRQRSGWFLAP